MSNVPYVPILQHIAQSAARLPFSFRIMVIIEGLGGGGVIEGNEELFFVRHLLDNNNNRIDSCQLRHCCNM